MFSSIDWVLYTYLVFGLGIAGEDSFLPPEFYFKIYFFFSPGESVGIVALCLSVGPPKEPNL